MTSDAPSFGRRPRATIAHRFDAKRPWVWRWRGGVWQAYCRAWPGLLVEGDGSEDHGAPVAPLAWPRRGGVRLAVAVLGLALAAAFALCRDWPAAGLAICLVAYDVRALGRAACEVPHG